MGQPQKYSHLSILTSIECKSSEASWTFKFQPFKTWTCESSKSISKVKKENLKNAPKSECKCSKNPEANLLNSNCKCNWCGWIDVYLSNVFVQISVNDDYWISLVYLPYVIFTLKCISHYKL